MSNPDTCAAVRPGAPPERCVGGNADGFANDCIPSWALELMRDSRNEGGEN
ncbi:MAG: hypothetical protein R6W94_01310 [Spirochaetia bacterium]